MRWLALLCCLLAVAGGLPTAAASPTDSPPSAATPTASSPSENSTASRTAPARIVELYPDPAAGWDAGEFVTIEFPAGTNLSRYALIDEDVPVRLDSRLNRTQFRERTRVTFSTKLSLTDQLTDRRVRRLPDRVQLANAGDGITLSRDGHSIQRVSYNSATEAEVYSIETENWRPLGATDHPIRTAHGGSVEAFVLPDEPTRAVEFLGSAEERIYLAGYTLSSQAVVDALVAAADRGVSVRVLVDGSPAGGMSDAATAALAELRQSGIGVRSIDGARARYRFHHAKYAVVDDRGLVTTENWKPSGLGGRSSRGWAVITDQREIVDGLVETFRGDRGWVDAISYSPPNRPPPTTDPSSERYPSEFEARSFDVEQTELLLAPDNADERIRKLIHSANDSVRIKQVSIGSWGFRPLQATLDAARRGVDVEILLSGAWYVEEENERFAQRLSRRAEAEGLPLDVRIADPQRRYEKIHAKGLIVDGETTVIGSLNWNNNSLRRNREVALVIESEGVAGYFGKVFETDWQAAGQDTQERSIPVGLLGAVCCAALLAVLGLRTITIDPTPNRA